MTGAAERVAEISEASATGAVAAVYDDIRRVTGVPTVALVYRILATSPDTIRTVWADLGPNLADSRVRSRALELAGAPGGAVAPIARSVVSVPLEAAAATLDGFARLNRLNLVALTALRRGVDAPPAPSQGDAAADTIPDGLPMADLTTLPSTTIALLEEMSEPIAGDERPLVVPSLFRYFAHDERLLRALWDALRPVVADPAFDRHVASLRREAATLAGGLPFRVRTLPPGPALDVVERFLRTIPGMIVVGGLLGQALGVAET